jgi:hypothetical protein
MRVFLGIFSLLWIAAGVMLILYTDKVRRFLGELFAKTDIRKLAVLPFAIGLVMLVGSFSQKEMFWLLFILGFLAVSKGVFLFLGPLSQIRSLLEWWFTGASEVTIRLWGIISLMVGAAVFSYVL